MSFYELQYTDDGRLETVIIKGKDGVDPIIIGSQTSLDIENAKSALRAAGDLKKFGIYDNPLTDAEIHFYRIKNGEVLDLKSVHYAMNIGVVSTAYAGSLPVPVPNAEDHPLGWAQINKHGDRYFLSPLSAEFGSVRAMKHDWIRDMLNGHALFIRVLPFNTNEYGKGYADVLINTWAAPMEEAVELRLKGLDKARDKRFLNRNVGRDVPAEKINGSVILTKKDGSTIDLDDLPKPSLVKVTTGTGSRFQVKWDGNPLQRLRLMQVSAGAKKGWTVEVPEGFSAS